MYAELISDSCGVHVHFDLQRMIVKNKGINRVVLITDSTNYAGKNPVEYAHVDDISFNDQGMIAGSKLTLDKACRNINYVDVDEIKYLHNVIKIPSNIPNPEDLPLAHKYKELHDAGRDDEIPYDAMELTTVVAEAARMCRLENGPEFFELDLSGIKLGGVALIGIPGEPFTDVGVGIKDTAGWELIMPCALVNGYVGYFPMKSAYDEGGYEARSSSFKSGVAERIIEGGKALLEKLDSGVSKI